MRMQLREVSDIGSAWVAGFETLVSGGHGALTIVIDSPLTEDVGVRREIEQTLVDIHRSGNADFASVQSMDTVASTIFPLDYYPAVGMADHFFEEVELSQGLREHTRNKQWGTYVGRLVQFPTPDGSSVNQLQLAIKRLTLPTRWKSVVEMPVEVPADFAATLTSDGKTDALFRGGPCLSHLSVTRSDNELSMIALYRHQTYFAKAYGNFLGLARLLAFLAYESGLQVGQLTITTGHAEAEGTNRPGLLGRVRAVAGNVSAVETVARAFGADSSDLELPRSARP